MRQQRLTPTYIIQVLGEAATCATFMNAPIVKATLQAGTLAVLSNVLAQIITSYQNNIPCRLDRTTLAHFVLYALLSTPPNFLWQVWLESRFPAHTASLSTREKEKQTVTGSTNHEKPTRPAPSLNVRNTVSKFLLDQTLGAAVNTVAFIAVLALFRGETRENIIQDVESQFWPMISAGLKLWPAVSLLSFTVVPVESRTLVGGLVGLGWGVFLSGLNVNKKGKVD